MTAGLAPRQALAQVEARLEAAGCPDAGFDARELFRLAAGRDARLSDRPLSAEEAARLEELTARRAGREPLQYICGRWPFLTFELAVGPGVLCPRPDTEVVAETAVRLLDGVEKPPVAGPLRRHRLPGPGGESPAARRPGRLPGKKPGGPAVSPAERPLRPVGGAGSRPRRDGGSAGARRFRRGGPVRPAGPARRGLARGGGGGRGPVRLLADAARGRAGP